MHIAKFVIVLRAGKRRSIKTGDNCAVPQVKNEHIVMQELWGSNFDTESDRKKRVLSRNKLVLTVLYVLTD